jgi:hypothetical protein
VDLYVYDEDVGRVGVLHRAGARLGTEAQARVADHAASGRLFLLREDYRVYALHLSRKLGLVLVEDGLNPREVAEIFFLAFRERVADFMDQPRRGELDRLRGDIAILAEYLWADSCRVGFLTGALHKEYDPTDKERYLVRRDRESIERHIEAGLRQLDRLGVRDQVVRQCLEEHHERLDGSGYPRGLRGEAVSLPGRLCAVADSFAAMIGRRPYRDGAVVAEAAAALVHEAGRYDRRLAALLAVLVNRGVPGCRPRGGAGA